MRPLNKIALLTAAATLCFSLSSFTTAGLTVYKSAKATVKKVIVDTEIRNVSGFIGIKSSNGIDVFISQGTTERVEVKADAETMKHLKTVVKDGVLEIYMEKDWSLGWSSWKSRVTEVHITAKTINSIVASSGSDVKSVTKIKSNKLSTKSSSGSDLTLDVEANELTCESSSGSDSKLSGTAKTVYLKASSGSDIDAFDLTAEVCTAEASSGSDINISVSKQLKADASSGGDISYRGNPSVSKEESSGGDVSKE
jgi:hypothetical protein